MKLELKVEVVFENIFLQIIFSWLDIFILLKKWKLI